VAVHAFMQQRISYPKLIEVVLRTLVSAWDEEVSSFSQILALDAKARQIASSLL
jgi:1-deoxy-D-xylulose 5-phosphate reductoisomerase